MTAATTLQDQSADGPSTAEKPNEFVAVRGGTDTTSAEALLVAGYLVMWALLLVFVFFTWRRQQSLDGRISTLEKALTKVDGGSG